jgi:dienelactone hydrolase
MKKLLFLIPLSLILTGCLATTVDGITTSSGEKIPVRIESSLADKTKKMPTVLIAHGSAGVTNSNRSLSPVINQWGYNAVIVDHYSLRGITSHTGREVAGATGTDRAKDLIETAKWVEKQPWHQGKIAVVGFSRGGGAVLTLVNERLMNNIGYEKKDIPISSASAFYPSCYYNPVPDKPYIPTQVQLAEKDDLAYISFCNFPRENPYEVFVHKNATHSFDENIPASARLIFTHRYDNSSTKKSRELLREFLDKNLK